MSPNRIVYLSLFTLCFYAFGIWISSGTLLFPIPLFKLSIFVVTIILIIQQGKTPKLTDLFAFLTALSLLATSKFVFQFLFSEEQLLRKEHFISDVKSVGLICFSFFYLLWQFFFSFKFDLNRRFFLWACTLGICISVLTNFYVFLPLFFLVNFVLNFKIDQGIHAPLSTFYSVLVIIITITSFFYPLNSILNNL